MADLDDADPFEQLERLYDRLRADDPAAIEELGRILLDILNPTARAQLRGDFPRLRGNLQTDDIIQDACLRVLESKLWKACSTPQGFVSLSKATVFRVLVEQARKLYGPWGFGRRNELGSDALGEPATTDHRSRRDARIDFPEFLATLSPEDAELFILRYSYNLKPKMIATLSGIAPSTVRRRLRNITEKFRDGFA